MKNDFLFLDVDECDESELTCGPTGQCQNTAGSYICLCPQGQYWDDETKDCVGRLKMELYAAFNNSQVQIVGGTGSWG